MVVGAVTIVVWYNVPVLKDFLYELIPGFFFSLLATWVVSMLTRKNAIDAALDDKTVN